MFPTGKGDKGSEGNEGSCRERVNVPNERGAVAVKMGRTARCSTWWLRVPAPPPARRPMPACVCVEVKKERRRGRRGVDGCVSGALPGDELGSQYVCMCVCM